KGQIKVGDVVGARESIAKALHWAVAIEDANQKVNAHLTIAKGQIKVGDVVGARESIAKTLQWAVALELRHNKLTVFRKIAKLQLKVGDITGAKRTAAARVQALATWGMQEWTEYNQANYSYLSEPAVADFKQFLKSLEDKNPIQVTDALAQAVEDMAKALKKLREEEANWQVWVKRLGSYAP
ncbi:MAG: hypothetical protein RX318_09330, partial [bacterium]|nr:hypothetical protein [bacterium]